MLKTFQISEIQTRPDIQIRTEMNEEAIVLYTELYRDGVKMQPISVWHDYEGNLILVDGHHRLEAARRAGLTEIEAYDEGTGTMAAFVEQSIQCNAKNGLALTKQDRKRAAEKLYTYNPQLTIRAIAEKVGLSKSTVGTIVADIQEETNATCKNCKSRVLKMFAEDPTNGWVTQNVKGKPAWFCCGKCYYEFFTKYLEKGAKKTIPKIYPPETENVFEDESGENGGECSGECSGFERTDEGIDEGTDGESGGEFSEECSGKSSGGCGRSSFENSTMEGVENERGTVVFHEEHEVCPFCGSPAEAVNYRDVNFTIYCSNSDCPVCPSTGSFDSLAEAWSVWDARCNPEEKSDEWKFFERLKDGMEKNRIFLKLEKSENRFFIRVQFPIKESEMFEIEIE